MLVCCLMFSFWSPQQSTMIEIRDLSNSRICIQEEEIVVVTWSWVGGCYEQGNDPRCSEDSDKKNKKKSPE